MNHLTSSYYHYYLLITIQLSCPKYFILSYVFPFLARLTETQLDPIQTRTL